MATFGFFRIFKGLNLVPKSGSTSTALGDFEVDSVTNKANFHNGTGNSPVVTESHTATLTNKTMDANSNTFSNFDHGVEVNNPSSGVHGVVGTIVGTSDSQTLTNKTIVAGSNTITGLLHGTQVNNPTSGVHGVVGTVVGTSDSQTLTNKTIDADSNTITNIENADIKTGAAIARTKLAAGTAGWVVFNNASTGLLDQESNLATNRGGTNLSSYTTGDTIYASATNVLSKLAIGSEGNFLKVSSGIPVWGAGGTSLSITSVKTTTYPITTADDVVRGDTDLSAFTFTLYTPVGNAGKVVTVKYTGTLAVNALTLTGTGLSTTLNTPNEELVVISDGTNWIVLSRTIPSTWTTFVPTSTFINANVTPTGKWRRVGDSMEVMIDYEFTGAPANNALTCTIPISKTIDTAKLPNSTSGHLILGNALAIDVGNTTLVGATRYDSSTSVNFIGNATVAWSQTSPFSWNNTDIFSATFKVPITGWNS